MSHFLVRKPRNPIILRWWLTYYCTVQQSKLNGHLKNLFLFNTRLLIRNFGFIWLWPRDAVRTRRRGLFLVSIGLCLVSIGLCLVSIGLCLVSIWMDTVHPRSILTQKVSNELVFILAGFCGFFQVKMVQDRLDSLSVLAMMI